MIVFRNIKFKNFMAVGETPVEIDLTASKTTLLVGQNGAGKSSMIEAISFALFGKPYRSIRKPQLVNSINGKGCLVEIEFTVGSHEFRVVRGMKPNKFEIWQNGRLINQDAATKDYQKHLEKNILKLNHKSFHQIVVLGSSSYVPFMQLPAASRREVIEDLLDIGIFTQMNQILKTRLQNNKSEIYDVEGLIEKTESLIEAQQAFIKDFESISNERIDEKNRELEGISKEIDSLMSEISALSHFIETSSEVEDALDTVQEKHRDAIATSGQHRQEVKGLVKEAKFFEAEDVCPTCSQIIDNEFRDRKLEEAKERSKELFGWINDTESEIAHFKAEIDKLTAKLREISSHNKTISANNRAISRLRVRESDVQNSLQALRTNNSDLEEATYKLDDLKASASSYALRKASLMDTRNYLTASFEMLKDTGIKTKIIKEYLPAMNQLINNYLQVMNFFVSFNLDENFNEVIKSRHRDEFQYSSFSEGEKSRIDLSLIFAWRQIARMKNSVATNLLILDEVMDSSMDAEGMDALMKILKNQGEETNIFVISHKSELTDGKFKRIIEFTKPHNFSAMKEIF
jgi:DNA repair exonuclease SbcCD ATPase subunit